MTFYCFSHVPSELPNGLVFLTFHQNTVNLTRDFKGPRLKQRLITKEKIIHSVYFISSPSGSIFIISRLLTSNISIYKRKQALHWSLLITKSLFWSRITCLISFRPICRRKPREHLTLGRDLITSLDPDWVRVV